MRVGIETACETDEPFLVSRTSFFELFDQLDFKCRDVGEIEQKYLEEWFVPRSDGLRGFLLPTVQYVQGKTQFVGGRHRMAVLLSSLAELPIAFTAINPLPAELRRQLRARPLVPGSIICIPDLPIASNRLKRGTS